VYRSDAGPRPSAQKAPADIVLRPMTPLPQAPFSAQPVSSASLFETGMALMTLPIAIAAGIMLAPLAWMWASRRPSQ
jgi:hypothetical protein